jgi:hypothetical protein
MSGKKTLILQTAYLYMSTYYHKKHGFLNKNEQRIKELQAISTFVKERHNIELTIDDVFEVANSQFELIEKGFKARLPIKIDYIGRFMIKEGRIWHLKRLDLFKEDKRELPKIKVNLKNVIPYLYRLNPAKTVKLLTDSQYKFYVYLYEDIRDPALMNVLVSHLIKDGNIDSKVFTILVSYHNPEINKQMIEIIQHIDCK